MAATMQNPAHMRILVDADVERILAEGEAAAAMTSRTAPAVLVQAVAAQNNGTVMLARETPTRGGDTLFACMNRAYEALSDGLKKTLEGLRAVHSSRHVFGEKSSYAKDAGDRLGNADAATQDAVHPVVLRHPESGKKILYVNSGFTTHFVGWTAEESAPLLRYLYEHAARPEFQYRFQWHDGSIAFWDNRSTWHYAVNDYDGERRLMHRITIAGGPLE